MIQAGFSYQGTHIIGMRSSNKSQDTLLLHGAGTATKERALPVVDRLEKKGFGCLAFDFLGHGATGGEIIGTTLRMREEQALIAADLLDHQRLIIGFSMGGHTAIQVGISRGFECIALFYPAIYPNTSIDAPFGQRFTKAIRQPNAWRASQLFSEIRGFGGSLVIIIGDRDEVVPHELPELLLAAADRARFKRLVLISNGPHALVPYLAEHPAELHRSIETIAMSLAS